MTVFEMGANFYVFTAEPFLMFLRVQYICNFFALFWVIAVSDNFEIEYLNFFHHSDSFFFFQYSRPTGTQTTSPMQVIQVVLRERLP